MKKTFALLLACLMLVAMLPGTAMAYEAVTPTATLKHTLALTNPEETTLDGTITYSFSVGSVSTEPANAFANLSQAVTGAPTISNLSYSNSDTFDNRQCTKDLPINWEHVSFKQPGVYKWAVAKTYTATGTNKQPSNNASTFYLYVYVTDNNGKLDTSVILTTAETGNGITSENKGNLGDTYPARTANLSITKNVTGEQGSKDQYFKFEVSLTAPSGVDTRTYVISGLDQSISESAYIPSSTTISNPTEVELVGGTEKTVILWMKHGQTAKIADLIFGTAYTIVETADGYTISSIRYEGTTTSEKTGATVTDTSLQADSVVKYTNDKPFTVPTGISLHTAAPVMGILLAMSLLAILFVGKRKEYVA